MRLFSEKRLQRPVYNHPCHFFNGFGEFDDFIRRKTPDDFLCLGIIDLQLETLAFFAHPEPDIQAKVSHPSVSGFNGLEQNIPCLLRGKLPLIGLCDYASFRVFFLPLNGQHPGLPTVPGSPDSHFEKLRFSCSIPRRDCPRKKCIVLEMKKRNLLKHITTDSSNAISANRVDS